MERKQLLGLIGSITLFVGVFMPIVSIPLVGNINYFQNGEGDGVIVLVLALISLILVLVKKFKGLGATGLASLIVMGFTFYFFQKKLSQMETELEGNPFSGLAMQSIQLQWGWAILVVGAGLLIASAVLNEIESKRRIRLVEETPKRESILSP